MDSRGSSAPRWVQVPQSKLNLLHLCLRMFLTCDLAIPASGNYGGTVSPLMRWCLLEYRKPWVSRADASHPSETECLWPVPSLSPASEQQNSPFPSLLPPSADIISPPLLPSSEHVSSLSFHIEALAWIVIFQLIIDQPLTSLILNAMLPVIQLCVPLV